MEFDLLNPDPREEVVKRKVERLVQKPDSFFIYIKCRACLKEIVHTLSHAQSVIKCKKCGEILATPTGGKLELKDGVHIRKKDE